LQSPCQGALVEDGVALVEPQSTVAPRGAPSWSTAAARCAHAQGVCRSAQHQCPDGFLSGRALPNRTGGPSDLGLELLVAEEERREVFEGASGSAEKERLRERLRGRERE
jgi:hypothetical protein